MKIEKTFFLTAIFLAISCSKMPEPYDYDVNSETEFILNEDKFAPDFEIPGEDQIEEVMEEKDEATGEDIVEEEYVDTVKPQVVSAFSKDGKGVTVRFSEDIDPGTGDNQANFTILGSDNSTLKISSADTKDQFVNLTLSQEAIINPSLTYEVIVKGVKDLSGNIIDPKANKAKIRRSVYLAIIWHQHQPLYLDPSKDELQGPWVRKHATKDYYDMASILKEYPDVNLSINITPVLLIQLLNYYVERMTPYVNVNNNTIDKTAFLAKYRGRTDPFVDLLLDETPDPFSPDPQKKPTEKQIGLYYDDPWSTLSTSEAIMEFFPEYKQLRDKNPLSYTHDDLLKLKIFFELAWFDPDFLSGAVKMPDGSVADLSDVVKKDGEGKFTLKVQPSEKLAERLLVENFKVMKNTVPIHKEMMYHIGTKKGQIEITTTPFYHPILPLITNTDLAKIAQPYDLLPSPPYAYPEDATAHVTKAVKYYEKLFGEKPSGMWPGEGSVAEEVVSMFTKNGVRWVATDQEVLKNSLKDLPNCYQCYPYKADGETGDELLIVFRDTGLSNKVGFTFQPLKGTVAAAEFLKDVVNMSPPFGGDDRLITVIMDGENAWESYTKEHDAKGFFHALYGMLNESYKMGEIIPVTVSEYIDGNEARNVPAHPVSAQKELEPLWAGSWIGGNFSIWIGESEENQAWEYLAKARNDLKKSGLPKPNPAQDPPVAKTSKAYYIYLAYEEMYAAEGSDWFWWYGADMTSPANDDTPFDRAFRTHLTAMYEAVNSVLKIDGKPLIEVPDFAPIVQAKPQAPSGPFTKAPVIDGLFYPNEGEWAAEGGFFFDNDSGGAIASPSDDIAVVYYGYTDDAFYLAVSMNEDMSKKLKSNYNVALYLSHKHIINPETGEFTENPKNLKNRYGKELNFLSEGAAWEVFLDFAGASLKTKLSAADGNENWIEKNNAITTGGPVSGGKLIELKIPFDDLQISTGDPLEMSLFASEGNSTIDSAPYSGSKVVFEDVSNLVYVTFEVDVTGNKVDINTYVNITNPPPPKGKGIVHIAGNHDKLQNWIPNKVALRDDGVAPDKVANDGIWTAVFGFTPGTLLRYKYTIGLPVDEGKWWGTEEFPLTERGFDVTKKPECKKMTLHDIFADRPNPTGTLGKMTVFDDCAE